MKFTAITISILLSIIASSKSKEAHGRRRHLNDVIKGEESDASMSMASVLYPARGGGSKSKSSPTPSPTTAPPAPGECNSIINTGGVFALQKHLVCDCSEDPALTVDGHGTVFKLNGYTVECKPDSGSGLPDIIQVLGTANKIIGPGTLKGGGSDAAGINLPRSGGFHTVKGITIGPDLGYGIFVSSNDSNTIINNFITEPGFDGVAIFGNNRNIIKGNMIVKARRGIRLNFSVTFGTADDNQVLDNTIIASGLEGILVVGKRNVIQGNTIDQSGENGIEVNSFTSSAGTFISEDVIIKDNSITNSNGDGIKIEPTSLNTVVIGNTIAGYTNDAIDNQGNFTIEAGNIEVM